MLRLFSNICFPNSYLLSVASAQAKDAVNHRRCSKSFLLFCVRLPFFNRSIMTAIGNEEHRNLKPQHAQHSPSADRHKQLQAVLTGSRVIVVHVLMPCCGISDVMHFDRAHYFLNPVDVEMAPDYKTLVTTP